MELVERGLAVFFNGEKSIRLMHKRGVPLESKGLRSEQGWVYERSAIENGARFVQGGLCRTENRPANIPSFKGARVGHQ
jgi:hypothetical protein